MTRGERRHARLLFGVVSSLFIMGLFGSCSVPSGALAQSCHAWGGVPRMCDQYYARGQPIYVRQDYSWDILLSEASALINGIVTSFSAEETGGCSRDFVELTCGTFLRPCIERDGQALPYPRQTCRENCAELVKTCAPSYNAINMYIGTSLLLPFTLKEDLTCEELDLMVAGSPPLFPERNYTIANGTEECYYYEQLQYTCAEPLELNEELQACSYTCPLPSLSDNQYSAAKVLQLVMGWLSWICSFVVIVSYLAHPLLRRYPSNLIAMTCVSANIAAFAFVMPTFSGHNLIWCSGDDRFYDITSGYTEEFLDLRPQDLRKTGSWCSFQGFVLQYGFQSGTFWWAFIALNMCAQLFYGNRITANARFILQICLHTCAWGIPFILSVVPAAAGKNSFESASTFCFISAEDNLAWQITFWFVPVGILLCLGLALFCIAVFFVVKFTFSPGGMQTKRKVGSKKFLALYSRLICFVLIFLVLYVIIFSYTIVTTANEDIIAEGYSEYYRCLLNELRDCSLSDSITNYPLLLLRAFAYSSFGFWLAVLFINSELLHYWNAKLGHVLPGVTATLGLNTSRTGISKTVDTEMAFSFSHE